jgi:hypothetical protein
MPIVASRITRVTLDVDRTITTGTIRVQNILVSNATNNAAEIIFLDNDDNNILNITAPPQDSESFPGDWIADNGLKIDADAIADANVVVTVLHGQDGA